VLASDTDSCAYLCRPPLSFPSGPATNLVSPTIPRLLEMQMFLVELLNHFEFGMIEEATRMRRQASLVMVATVRG
jgi:hypothetical protein